MIRIKAKKIDERIAENYSKIKIGGIAEIIYGDNIVKCKNKWTRYFMSSIVVFIANACHHNYGYNTFNVQGMGGHATARVGTDTTTQTTPDMSDLVNRIDVAPDSVTRRAMKEPDYTLYTAEFIFTWNAGTLPNIYEGATGENEVDGEIGELGVFLTCENDDWSSGLLNPNRQSGMGDDRIPIGGAGVRLASRIASADGAFDAFEHMGSTEPLTFKWIFRIAVV